MRILEINKPENVIKIYNNVNKGILTLTQVWNISQIFSDEIFCTGCPKVECAFWKCCCSKTVKHIDQNWCFLNSQHYNFWYSCLTFVKKIREMKKISIWKKIPIFLDQKFFAKFFENFFFALNYPKMRFEAKNFFRKVSKKIYDIIFLFFSNRIFKNFPCLFRKG